MTLDELRRQYNNGTKFNFVFFWGAKPKSIISNAVFSQWYMRDFVDENNVKYNCCEQYMMAQKALLFKDDAIYKEIMKSTNPKDIKALGRKVSNFDEKIWNENCMNIVEKGNYFKFSQNKDLKEYLLKTNDAILVEASPYDPIWGIKMSKDDPNVENPNCWKGTNYLGFALTNVKNKIRSEE